MTGFEPQTSGLKSDRYREKISGTSYFVKIIFLTTIQIATNRRRNDSLQNLTVMIFI